MLASFSVCLFYMMQAGLVVVTGVREWHRKQENHEIDFGALPRATLQVILGHFCVILGLS